MLIEIVLFLLFIVQWFIIHDILELKNKLDRLKNEYDIFAVKKEEV